MNESLSPLKPEGHCPKCGHKRVLMIYCKGTDPYNATRCYFRFGRDHLHRRCNRCHYEWHEATTDTGNEEQGQSDELDIITGYIPKAETPVNPQPPKEGTAIDGKK